MTSRKKKLKVDDSFRGKKSRTKFPVKAAAGKSAFQRAPLALKDHHIELEMQNGELRRTQQELEAARDSYAGLFDFAPTALLTLDASGKIMAANLAAGSLLGLERSD